MFDTLHIVIGIQHLNLIHALLLIPKRVEKVVRKCKKTVEVAKPVLADHLTTTLVHRWVTPKEDLNSLQEGVQYPLNRLKQFLSSPESEVLVTLHPKSDKCVVDEAHGNHLHIIFRHRGDMTLVRETAKAFKAIGGYCIGTDLDDCAICDTLCYLKKPKQVFMGSTSTFLLDKWNDTNLNDDLYNSDFQWCLPDSDFKDLSSFRDEEREAEIERCGELPIGIPIRQEISKKSQSKKRKLIIIDSDEEEDGRDTEDTLELS